MSAVLLLGLRALAAAALYAFIGWTLYLLWRSLQQETVFLSSRKVTPLNLIIQTSGESSQTLQFSQGDILIGRDPECEVILDDVAASARHARLAYHHNQWWLEDLQSTNGTKLNNETVQTATIVVNGDTIQCGQTVLLIKLE
jgi:pSer/pThr/pTyr-binding forkhead associated (FHA) protein